jgi:hypothetical protein
VTAETRELRICRIVRMTLTACCPLARMLPTFDAEELRVMIECGGQPSRRCMARFARVTQVERRMIPRCRNGEVCLMALIAVRVYELVIAAHVAVNAGSGRMLSSERESRRCVVE